MLMRYPTPGLRVHAKRCVCSLVLMVCLLPFPVLSEEGTFGSITLGGLARENWDLNPPGDVYAMVCNVEAPDQTLPVYAGPGADHDVLHRLDRLTTIDVHTGTREGEWIKVISVIKEYSTEGVPLDETKTVPVDGWVSDAFVCDYFD